MASKIEKEIQYLLGFVGENERNLFERMYSDGISAIPNKKHALQQIERTLLNRTIQAERNSKEKESLKEANQELSEKNEELRKKVRELEDKLADCSTPANYTLDESDYDKLLFLQALENAGVDNWDGYEFVVDDFDRMKRKRIGI